MFLKTATKFVSNPHSLFIRQMGRGRPKLSVNHNYFKDWTIDNAYILGYIFADGCLHQTKTGAWKLQLGCWCVDQRLIIDIANKIDSNYKLGLYNTSNPHCQMHHHIQSSQIAHDLMAKGCYPRKSQHLLWLQNIRIQKPEILSNFILGYFDGDGCIMSAQGCLHMKFAGT